MIWGEVGTWLFGQSVMIRCDYEPISQASVKREQDRFRPMSDLKACADNLGDFLILSIYSKIGLGNDRTNRPQGIHIIPPLREEVELIKLKISTTQCNKILLVLPS